MIIITTIIENRQELLSLYLGKIYSPYNKIIKNFILSIIYANLSRKNLPTIALLFSSSWDFLPLPFLPVSFPAPLLHIPLCHSEPPVPPLSPILLLPSLLPRWVTAWWVIRDGCVMVAFQAMMTEYGAWGQRFSRMFPNPTQSCINS